jgi:hypothetical protein
MILPTSEEKAGPPAPYSLDTLHRLPLAEAFYQVWAFVAPDDFLAALFGQHRGRCYQDLLSFSELVHVLADAITRYQGSGHRAITKALEHQQLSTKLRAVYGKLGRLPLPLAEAMLSGLTSRLRSLFPAGLFRSELPASLAALELVVLDGKKIKRAAKRLLATRGRPGKLFGGKILAAYSPANGLAVAMAADPDGEANDIRLMPRVMALAREAVGGPRLWIADRQFCDLDQPRRFTEEEGDHFVIRFSAKTSFTPDPRRRAATGVDTRKRAFTQEWGWMGRKEDPRRRYVRRIGLERPGEETILLVTDLLDESTYPAADLLEAYLLRWQIENAFQQITEVFDLRHLIGCTPRATVFQASLCLVIYNIVQVIRAYAALSGPSAVKVETLSSEKLFLDLREELTSVHRVLKLEELLSCLSEVPTTAGQVGERLRELLGRAWSANWKKAVNKKPQPFRPPQKQSGAHTSIHKVLEEANARRRKAISQLENELCK